jgi:hypothetical protein
LGGSGGGPTRYAAGAMSNPYAPPLALEARNEAAAFADRVFTLRFELTEADVVAFQVEHGRRIAGGGRWALRVLGVLFTAIGLLLGEGMLVLPVVGVLMLGMALWIGSRPQIELALRAARRRGQRMADLGSWNLELGPNGVAFSTATRTCDLRWQAIESVVDGAEQVLIYTNPLSALIVPKVIFGSALEAEAFVRAASHHLENDRRSRGEPMARPARKPVLVLVVLWVILVLLFLALWGLLSR